MTANRLFTTVAAAGMAAMLAVAATPATAQLKSITIGTNPSGTTYFVLGSGLAKTFQQALEIRTTAQPHAGSSVYLPLMDKGEITMGLNSSLDSALAYNGQPPYGSATKNVRSLARVWLLPYAYFAKANSGIQTVADLKGKKVQVGIKSNVSLGQLNETILRTAGITRDDVQVVESGGIVQGINMVVEGRADAAVSAMAIPALVKAHTSIPGGIRVLALGDDGTDEFMAHHTPGSQTLVVNPSKRNVGVEKPTKIAAFQSFLNISGSVSDDDAYKIAKALHDNWSSLQKDHPQFRGVPQDGLAPASNVIPYHPGAIRFYKEVGIWNAENDKKDEMLLN